MVSGSPALGGLKEGETELARAPEFLCLDSFPGSLSRIYCPLPFTSSLSDLELEVEHRKGRKQWDGSGVGGGLRGRRGITWSESWLPLPCQRLGFSIYKMGVMILALCTSRSSREDQIRQRAGKKTVGGKSLCRSEG